MVPHKKIAVASALVIFMITGIAATSPSDAKPKRNLKILPKDITPEDLDKIMDGFKDALGVKCNFCHAPSKDPNERKPDFASDEKPEKNIARKMMKMTSKINKKYFSYIKEENGGNVQTVTCITCHRGNSHPENKGTQ